MHNWKQYPDDYGAALVMSLILAMIMSMLSLSSMRNTLLEEKMTHNTRDTAVALEAAEAGLREAEVWLELQTDPDLVQGQHFVYAAGELAGIYLLQSSWWLDPQHTAGYGLTGITASAGFALAPRFVIEYRTFIPDQETGPAAASRHGNYVYSVISRGTGRLDQTQRILKTTLIKRYDLEMDSVTRQSWQQLR